MTIDRQPPWLRRFRETPQKALDRAGSAPRRWHAATRPAAANRRITLHIGPHKTATTTFQETLRLNRAKLAPFVTVIRRKDPLLDRICAITRQTTTPDALRDSRTALHAASQRFGDSCRHLNRVLVSHEDLMGARPTLRRTKGLYSTGVEKLVIITRALEAAGAEVEIVFIHRPFDDWVASLQRDLRRHVPAENRAAPAHFARRFDFPQDGWAGLLMELRAAFGSRLNLYDMAEDVAEGQAGISVLRHVGVPESALSGLRWSGPRRITRPADSASADAPPVSARR